MVPRKVSLFIATSLDGYIARINGSIDWLFTEGESGYGEFIKNVDTILWGRKTFDDVADAPYPFAHIPSFVFTHRLQPPCKARNVTFTSESVTELVRRQKEQAGGTIWVMGGRSIVTPLIKAGLIDELVISTHPVLLGSGIPLTGELDRDIWWRPTGTRIYSSGLIETRLELKE